MRVADWHALDAGSRAALLERPAVAARDDVRRSTLEIVARVRAEGDAALRELTLRLDGADLGDFEVGEEEAREAEEALAPEQRAALDAAVANVRHFHEAQRRPDVRVETAPGVVCERLSRPIASVGLYVPAGSSPLPSTAVMLCVPARLAGCPVVTLCTPPRADGRADPAVVAAARRAGTARVFKLGGAQAIAAMAYGTATVPKADKLFGPGNAWVTAAKMIVAADPEGAVADMPAGPSELLVIADEDADAVLVAADLLSQAEHGPDSQVLLVTPSARLAAAVASEVDRQLDTLPRATIARRALAHGAVVRVRDLDEAVEVSNAYAPEHLIIQTREPRRLLPGVSCAGSVFLGAWAPETIGDYLSGTNHVLPTYGYARSLSGLSLDDFELRMSVQSLTAEGLAGIGPAAVTLARLEGLDAHARAVEQRLERLPGGRTA